MIIKLGSISDSTIITAENWQQHVVDPNVKQDSALRKPSKIVLDPGFVYLRNRAVSAGEYHGPNANWDYFPEEHLKHSYKTFIGRGIYCNHDSDDVKKSIGIILDAEYNPDGHYVECLLAVDKNSEIGRKIDMGIIDGTSMGCMVSECECSVCGNIAKNEKQYCDHLKFGLGQEFGGIKAYSINKGLNFYEDSFVTVPADTQAVVLERLASNKIAAYLKLAQDYSLAKQAEEPKTNFLSKDELKQIGDVEKDKEPSKSKGDGKKEDKPESKPKETPKPKEESKPKPKADPKPKVDEPVSMQEVITDEVDRGIENAIVNKVREILKREHPEKALPISEQDLTNIVREKINERKPQAGVVTDVHRKVKALVDGVVAKEEKEPKDAVELGDGFSVKPTDHKDLKLVELFQDGKPKGVYTEPISKDDKDVLVKEYRQTFYLDPDSEQENNKQKEQNEKKPQEISDMDKLDIRYKAGSTLENSYFIATKGGLQTAISAAKLLDGKTVEAINKSAKGTEFTVGDAAADGTEKPDTEHTLGKEKAQPSDHLKGLKDEKGVGDAAFAGTEKPDSEHKSGTDPIQPSDVVKKYADLAQNSIVRLAKSWGGTKIVSISTRKVAKLDNSDSGLAREEVKPTAKPGDALNDKSQTEMVAREPKKSEAKPQGNRGGEQIKYYGKFNKGTLSENGGEQWARKVASLQTQLKQANDKAVKAELQANLMAKQLETQKKIAEDKEKAQLVSSILGAEEALGHIAATNDAIMNLRDTGLGLEEAEVKAFAMAKESEKKRLSAMSNDALFAIAETLTQFKAPVKTASVKLKASNAPELYRETELESEELKLSNLWS